MYKKIKVAVLDDDESMHDILQDMYHGSDIVDIKYSFTQSRKFIDEAPLLDFDLCFLDINIPFTGGLVVAQLLNNKPFIFVTGSDDRLKDALGLEPIDVVTKPFTKIRLDHAIDKAYKLIWDKIEYALFNVAESERKVKIHIPDIMYVNTDDTDARHKIAILKSGVKYTLMDCSLEELLAIAPHLVQVNRRELIALDSINEMVHDVISVHKLPAGCIPGELTLGPSYKKNLSKRIFFK